jgi:hypothetical protein
MSEQSKVPIPKDWPNFGEPIFDYRKRMWEKHQARISKKIAAGEGGELMNFQEWESKFLNEVDSNYELNKGKKAQPKPATRKRSSRRLGKSSFSKKNIVGLLWLVLIVGGCGGFWTYLAVMDEAPAPVALTVMPNLMGRTVAYADEVLEANCEEIECSFNDLADGDRTVWSSDNWIIVDQSPRVGAALTSVSAICFGVVKTDEKGDALAFRLSEACPLSELDFREEQATAWTLGYKDFGNGFAGGINSTEACLYKGRNGYCAYGTVITRDGTTGGSVIIVQWGKRLDPTVASSPFIVDEVSVFSTTGGASPGAKISFTAFIPNSKSWYWSLQPVLYQVN